MKKDNNLMKFTSFVLLVVMIALILVAGTFAKYTSEATGVATATVAKWDIKAGVQGEEVSITGDDATVAFNLFDTILEENGNEEYDVIRDDEGKVLKIAPGTSGAFDLSIVNDSEVTAAYTVEFLVEGAEVPFEFNVNNNGWTTSLDNVGETIIEMGKSQVVNVEWKWAFEGDDVVDTALGIAAEDVTVTATLTVNQYDDSEGGSQESQNTLTAGNFFAGDSSNVYGTVAENKYLSAGTTIEIVSGCGLGDIYVYAQDSETQTAVDTVYKQGTTVTIDDAGWYGIVLSQADGQELGYETFPLEDLITITQP